MGSRSLIVLFLHLITFPVLVAAPTTTQENKEPLPEQAQSRLNGIHEKPIASFVILTNDPLQVLSCSEDRLVLWDSTKKKPPRSFKIGQSPTSMYLSPDQRTLLLGCSKAIHIWRNMDWSAENPLPMKPTTIIPVEVEKITDLVGSANGNLVAYLGSKSGVGFLDPQEGKVLSQLKLPSPPLRIGFSNNHRTVGIVTSDGLFRLWSLGKRIGTQVPPNDQEIWRKRIQTLSPCLAFSPNGQIVAVASGGRAFLMETVSGRFLASFEREFAEGDVQSLSFTTHGQFLAVGMGANPRNNKSEEGDVEEAKKELEKLQPLGAIRFWDVKMSSKIKKVSSQLKTTNQVQFTLDGKGLISVGDSTSILWNTDFLKPPPSAVFDFKKAWEVLDSDDIRTGSMAVDTFIQGGSNAVEFVTNELKRIETNRKQMADWITKLDSDDFRTREFARKSLVGMKYRSMPILRETLKQKISANLAERIKSIIRNLEEDGFTYPEDALYGESLLNVRVVQILERIGDKGAIEALSQMAEGKSDLREIKEAKAALEYLKK
jgi:WD40 repeat protein